MFTIHHFIDIRTAMNVALMSLEDRSVAISDAAMNYLVSFQTYFKAAQKQDFVCEHCKSKNVEISLNCRNCGSPNIAQVETKDEVRYFGIVWFVDYNLKDLEYEIKWKR